MEYFATFYDSSHSSKCPHSSFPHHLAFARRCCLCNSRAYASPWVENTECNSCPENQVSAALCCPVCRTLYNALLLAHMYTMSET